MVGRLDLKRCFETGLLKRAQTERTLVPKELHQAGFFLKEAGELLLLGKDIIAVLPLYNAFFHCARAVLFRDGIKERSHFCIARYLEEEYVKSKKLDAKFLEAFETAMNIRHEVQYSTEPIEIEEDLTELHTVCEEFIEAMRSLCS